MEREDLYKEFLHSPFIEKTVRKPSADIKQLFKLLGFICEDKIEDFHNFCQRNFLRGQNQQRWDVEFSDLDSLISIVKPLLIKMGFVDAIFPKRKKYTHIFVHGGIYWNLRTRLKFLDDLWIQGIHAHKIVVVCGERPLLDIESPENVFDPLKSVVPFRHGWVTPSSFPRTQEEMARLIWDQITSDSLRNKNIQFLTVRDTINPKTNVLGHANTEDTLNAWLEVEEDASAVLAISNNPYIGYQHAKLRNALYKFSLLESCHFETVGEKADSNIPIKIYLDTLARWLDTDLHFLVATA